MTIILFLIDTSASMNQRAYLGGRPTLLDVAKGAVETFLKIRQRDSASRGDRYMLLTLEDPPANIKAGWKENHATFMNELKNIHSNGMSTLGAALRNAFDVLNINRMQTRIDTYGQGRSPFYLEPAMIIVITDGGKLTNSQGIQEDTINLPMHSPIPGSELTREPFRWDQRLFSLVLRLGGTPPVERDPAAMVASDTSPIDAMCEVTGGRSYAVTSQRILIQCLESLVQKIQCGVVINFEKVGPDPTPLPNEGKGTDDLADLVIDVDEGGLTKLKDKDDGMDSSSKLVTINQNKATSRPVTPTPQLSNNNNTAWHNCRKLIYVPRSAQKGYSVGHWPIPESFWPDVNSPSLPPRTAHPVVKFTCTAYEPMVIENLPFDKYEMEPSPLTQLILSRKQPTVCWQVFVSSSYRNSELGYPFGYLKASTNLTCVNLFIMPYNYPVLLPLLDDFFKIHRLKPTRDWKMQFDGYLKSMPLYYATPLKRALQRMGAPNLVPDNMETCLSYTVLNHLKRLQNQAKSDYDKLIASVGSGKPLCPEGIRVAPRFPPKKDRSIIATGKALQELKEQKNEFTGFMLGIRDRELQTQRYRNPFDIPRKSLLDQVARMRANYLQTSIAHTRLQDEDQLHNLSVGQMGNYQDYLKRIPPPLREIELAPTRQHMFGNPFKIDKRMMVDEADIDLVGSGSSSPSRPSKRSLNEANLNSLRPNKRKPGPLPRDIPLHKLLTPPVSPCPSPIHVASYPSPLDVRIPEPPSPTKDKNVHMNGLDDMNQTLPTEVTYSPTPSPENNNETPELNVQENHISILEIPELMNHVDNNEEYPNLHGEPEESKMATECVVVSPSVLADNNRLRLVLFRELKRPGRNFDSLFYKLNTVQGDTQTRVRFIKEIILEAARFKRKHLVQILTNLEQTLISSEPWANKFSATPCR